MISRIDHLLVRFVSRRRDVRRLRRSTRTVRRGRLALTITCTLFGASCYRYVPVDLTAVRPAEDVRLRVSEAAAARLVREFGTYLTELEGEIAREGADSVSIKVPISRDYRGVALERGHQVLFLGRSEVLGLRRREFSRGRTVAVGVGTLVAFGLLVAAVTQWGGANSEVVEPPPPPPPSGAILRFRIP